MRILSLCLVTLASVLWIPPAHAALECPAERALYTLNADAAFTARFIPARNFASVYSDLYFEVTSPQRSYWFTFTASQGYSTIYLQPVGDPYVAADGDPNNGPVTIEVDAETTGVELAIYPMTAALEVLGTPPNGGEAAPPYLFTPQLGMALWYGARALSTDPGAGRDSMDRGVFVLTGCAETAPDPGFP